jgi:hypothetical protein
MVIKFCFVCTKIDVVDSNAQVWGKHSGTMLWVSRSRTSPIFNTLSAMETDFAS